MSTLPTLLKQHDAVVVALGEVCSNPALYSDMDDAGLIALARVTAREQQLVATNAALIAGEIARRSAPSLGATGLAQRLGHRTPQELVRVTTGSTKREATSAVRTGQLTAAPELEPWLTPVGNALVERALSPAHAEAIRNGLGEPTDDVPSDTLRAAAAHLCSLAPRVDADRLYVLAREHRDAMDEAGIADRERARHERRSLRLRRLSDGMAQLTWTLDPESASLVGDLFDRATSPRRGGPRFVNADDLGLSEGMRDDERTTEQLASDVFLDLLVHGADTDTSQLLGTGAPFIRVLVTEKSLSAPRGGGHASIEGQAAPISMFTFDRLACGGFTIPVEFDDDAQVVRMGRRHRLYTQQQRIALAVRDGGCRWPGCERPPSWCEAHHITQWARDGGSTDIADGVLLCRHHHLLSHNNGWEITRERGKYSLHPPRDVDPHQKPIPIPTKSVALRELLGA
jgi:hypothetical protein